MKRLLLSLLLPLLTVSLIAGRSLSGGRHPPESKVAEARLRRPAALVAVEDGRRLFVANRRAGTVSAIDADGGRVIAEAAVGRMLADLADAGAGKLLAVDEAAGELVVLERGHDRLGVAGRVRVGDTPVSVRVLAQGRAVVCCLWPRQLVAIDATASGKPRLTKTIDLPFAPRGLLVLPGGVKIVVADAFGGRLAVVDAERGVVESLRSVPGHNIRGLALSADGKELMLSQQVLAEETPARADDIRWGNVIQNGVRSLALDDVLQPDADLLRHSSFHPLGEFRRGAADPAGLAVVNGKTIVALAGTGEVAVGPKLGRDWPRLRVGRRPTALAHGGRRVFVANTFDDTITILDSDKVEKTAEISLGSTPELKPSERGELMFFDARLSVEGWMSCHSCHGDGHTNGLRSDTLSDGSYGAPKRVPTLLGVADTEPWAWNGGIARLEDQVSQSIRTTMRGPRPTKQQVADLTAYLRTLAPPPPYQRGPAGESAHRGETVFRTRGCVRCHAAPTYTTSRTYEVGLEDEMGTKAFNPPSLRGIGRLTAFFHDGRAATLEEVFLRYRHQVPADMPRNEVDNLLAFLKTL
ncbi:MAG: cytochrome c peroxidase [Gemmataceae bacterium]